VNKKDFSPTLDLTSRPPKLSSKKDKLLYRCKTIFRATQIEYDNGLFDCDAPIFLERSAISTTIGELLLADDSPQNVSFLRVVWGIYEQQLTRWSYFLESEYASALKH